MVDAPSIGRAERTLRGEHRESKALYDAAGRHVRTLVDAKLPAGTHSVVWDGKDDAGPPVTGACFYPLEASGTRSSRKSLLLK
jgi:flagellar hook assembly protein FlgD